MFEKKEETNQENPFAQEELNGQDAPQNAGETGLQDDKEVNLEDNLRKEIEDINNKYLRLAADFDNYRKRQMQERESLIKYGAQDTLKKIIPVLDTFDRAHLSIEKLEDVNEIKNSYEICIKQLSDVLTKMNLQKIEAAGKEFDPNTMEAVMQTPTDEQEPHTVIAELQSGYRLYDRVLRPAMVNVAVEKENKEN